jgi:hypothetical protein
MSRFQDFRSRRAEEQDVRRKLRDDDFELV